MCIIAVAPHAGAWIEIVSINYGTGAGLGGWNCRHSFFPYFEGMARAYTDKQLKSYEARDYTCNGQAMTEYEATQQQRYIERQIRRWKREEAALGAAGLPTDEATAKIAKWRDKQQDFLSKTGLKRRADREEIASLVLRRRGLSAKNSASSVPNSVPKFAGKIDITDRALVDSRLEEFMRETLHDDYESAYVILKNGKTYRFSGGSDRVHPEALGSALKDAVVTHNHPINESLFSFSGDDFEFFANYHLAELYGFDERYSYVLRRTGKSPKIEMQDLRSIEDEFSQHQLIYEMSEREGIYYERIRKTTTSSTGGGR